VKRQGAGMGMQDFGVLWIWGSCGDTHRIFCGYGMGMGILQGLSGLRPLLLVFE